MCERLALTKDCAPSSVVHLGNTSVPFIAVTVQVGNVRTDEHAAQQKSKIQLISIRRSLN